MALRLRIQELAEETGSGIENANQFSKAIGIVSPRVIRPLWTGMGFDPLTGLPTGEPPKMIRLETIRRVVELYGLDPQTTTLAQLFDGWRKPRKARKKRAVTVGKKGKRPP